MDDSRVICLQKYSAGQVWYWEDPIVGKKSDEISVPSAEANMRYSRYILILKIVYHDDDRIDTILAIPLSTSNIKKYDLSIRMLDSKVANLRLQNIMQVSYSSLINFVGSISTSDFTYIQNQFIDMIASDVPYGHSVSVTNHSVTTGTTSDSTSVTPIPRVETGTSSSTTTVVPSVPVSNKRRSRPTEYPPIPNEIGLIRPRYDDVSRKRIWTLEMKRALIHEIDTYGYAQVGAKYQYGVPTLKSYYYSFMSDISSFESTVENDAEPVKPTPIIIPATVKCTESNDDKLKRAIGTLGKFVCDSLEDIGTYATLSPYWIKKEKMFQDPFYLEIQKSVSKLLLEYSRDYYESITDYSECTNGTMITLSTLMEHPEVTNYRDIIPLVAERSRASLIDIRIIDNLAVAIKSKLKLIGKGLDLIGNNIKSIWCISYS